MRKLWSVTLGCAFVLLASTLANAQATRTWVSGVGDDVNPCTRTLPCKTFAVAISKTLAKGEINVLDSGGYGTLTITKPISIIAEGFTGGVLAAGTNGVNINIASATATDVVVLRGLDINGNGTGLRGVNIISAGAVHIDNCHIYGFIQAGIQADQTLAKSRVFVRNTYVHNANTGLLVGQTVRAVVDNFRSEHNATAGIWGTLNARIHVRDSVLSANMLGMYAMAGSQATLRNTTVGYNTNIGVFVTGAGSIVRIGNTTVTANTTGLGVAAGGQIISFGSNHVDGNGTDGAPTSTPGSI